MSIKLRTVTDYVGKDAPSRIQKMVKVAEDLNVGVLVGLNSDGEAVVADAATGVPAVGVVYKTSVKPWDEGITFQNLSPVLEAGEYLQLAPCCIIRNADELDGAAIGQPVYLGANGLLTLTKNATSGELNQKVGVYATDDDNAVRIMLTDIGEENA